MTSTLKWPLGPCVKWPLPLMCPVLIFITPLHFSNAELLVYLITYKLRIRTLFHLPLASTWFFSSFLLTYEASTYLAKPSSEGSCFPKHFFTILLQKRSPSLLCYLLASYMFWSLHFFSLKYNHFFTYFFHLHLIEFLESVSCSSLYFNHLVHALVLNKVSSNNY